MKLKNIKKLREEYNWSQSKMANYLYFSLTKYNNFENGKIPLMVEDLFKISYLFNVRCEYLAEITSNKTPLTEEERLEIKAYLNEMNFKTDIYNR